MSVLLIALILAAGSYAIMACLMPTPKIKPINKTGIEWDRKPVEEPEFEFDPLAFWLFPDWDSGPPEEPFWMRPLKQPRPSFNNEPNFSGMSVIPGRYRIEPVFLERHIIGKRKPERLKTYRYFVDDQEVMSPAMRRPPKT